MTSPEESKSLVQELKKQWKTLWHRRIEDRLRAEGIADKDYSMLFVERGTVIIASREYKPLDFNEIVRQHLPLNAHQAIPPSPSVGGWGRFARTVLGRQPRFRRLRREIPQKGESNWGQPLKKGGRGWLHRKRRA